MLITVLAVLTALVAVADWGVVVQGRRDLETWFKPATLALLTVTVMAAGVLDHAAGVWLVAALVLGMLGDIALLDETVESRFVAGLGAFLVGHLAYVVCFARLLPDAPWAGAWAYVGVAVVALALAIGNGVLPGARREGGWGLVVPVAVYMGVIGVMTIAAWLTHDWWIALGASVFVCSDSVLAINKFVRPLAWARPVIMVTYHVGQALIAAGVVMRLS